MLTFFLILLLRHLFFDRGWKKSTPTEVPSLCIGNVAVGGTGKTPMTELVLRTLKEDEKNEVPLRLAVLSRGYKRRSKGFLLVEVDGTADEYGDEPLQIKRKFPDVTVAVDENRVEGALLLAGSSNLIILDDAFQHRSIIPTKSMLLTTFGRPFWKDRLLPFGRLRDLPSRALAADMIVVTKCPSYLMDTDRLTWVEKLGLKDFDSTSRTGINAAGRSQILLFATVEYEGLLPVFPEGNIRFIHSKLAILFSGIADDSSFCHYIADKYKIVAHENFPDHHFYSKRNIAHIEALAAQDPTAIIVTTEKDAQRLRDCKLTPNIRHRLFYAPVRTVMLTPEEQGVFKGFLQTLQTMKLLA